MRKKNNTVKIKNMNPKLKRELEEITEVMKKHGLKDRVVTSGNDSAHGDGSLHFTDDAIDLRSNILTDEDQDALAHDIQKTVGKDLTVVSEHFNNPTNNHIHVEVDVTVDDQRAYAHKEYGFNRHYTGRTTRRHERPWGE